MDTERFDTAVALLESGEVEKALLEFESIANLERNLEEKGSILLNLCAGLMRLGRFTEARHRWSESIACWTNLYTDYLDVSLCFGENRRDEALLKLTEFLKKYDVAKDSDDEELYSDAAERLAYLLFDLERYVGAIEAFQKALVVPGTDGRKRELNLYLGMCYIQLEKFAAAESMLTESLPFNREDPLWPRVKYQLGRLYFKQGAFTRAKTALDSCKSASPNSDVTRNACLLLAEVERCLSPGAQPIM